MRSEENKDQGEEVGRREKEITILEAFHALALWLFNTNPFEKVDAIFGDNIHPLYREEKAEVAATGFAAMWGTLDHEKKRILIGAVIDKYGSEAQRWKKIVESQID